MLGNELTRESLPVEFHLTRVNKTKKNNAAPKPIYTLSWKNSRVDAFFPLDFKEIPGNELSRVSLLNFTLEW